MHSSHCDYKYFLILLVDKGLAKYHLLYLAWYLAVHLLNSCIYINVGLYREVFEVMDFLTASHRIF